MAIEVDNKVAAYNGNPLLKRTNQQIEWTEEMVSEYVKCSEDPVYFINNYMKIINLDKGLTAFKLYDYQEEMVNSFKNNRNTMAVNSRQSGKCQKLNTPIRLRNRKTGEIVETTIGDFYNDQKLCKLQQ